MNLLPAAGVNKSLPNQPARIPNSQTRSNRKLQSVRSRCFAKKHSLSANNLPSMIEHSKDHEASNPSLTVNKGCMCTLCRSGNVNIVNDHHWNLAELPRTMENHLKTQDNSGRNIDAVKLDMSAIQQAHDLTWMTIEDVRLFSWMEELWGIGAMHNSNSNKIQHFRRP